MKDALTYMANLHKDITGLCSVTESLVTFLDKEVVVIGRKDQVARLKSLRTELLQDVESLKRKEECARQDHKHGRAIRSTMRITVGIIASIPRGKIAKSISDNLLDIPPDKATFGTVLIKIGPKGLTEGVEVVSVSRIARESGKEETEIIKDLEKNGSLLLNEIDFPPLIDRLIVEILKGSLSLPISLGAVRKICGVGRTLIVPRRVIITRIPDT